MLRLRCNFTDLTFSVGNESEYFVDGPFREGEGKLRNARRDHYEVMTPKHAAPILSNLEESCFRLGNKIKSWRARGHDHKCFCTFSQVEDDIFPALKKSVNVGLDYDFNMTTSNKTLGA